MYKQHDMTPQTNYNEKELLKSFNNRDEKAFSVIFRMLYKELFLYSSRLFSSLNLSPEDAIQDVFIDIWSRTSVQFPSLNHIKSFCLVALKNTYKNKIKHLNYQEYFKTEMKVKYKSSQNLEEADQYHSLYEALQLLPKDLAQIIRMYLEGWKPEEIAQKLGIALQTVYNRRREAIIKLLKIINTSDR